MDENVNFPVECHSGYRYGERPVALHWEDERLEIVDILTQWRSPEGLCFRVQVQSGQVFELLFSEGEDSWYIKLLSGESSSRDSGLYDTGHLSRVSNN